MPTPSRSDLYAPPDGPRYDQEPDWLEEQRGRRYDPRRTVIHEGAYPQPGARSLP